MKKKTIVVTGGAGHVGSHVIERLLQKYEDAKIISLDNYFNGSKKNHITGAEYRRGHTKDISRLIPEKPDIVFHLGEYARIAPSFDDAEEVYDMNISGTFAVANYCLKHDAKLVYAASSTKFASEGDGRHQNPYSFTKAVNVDLLNDYGRWYGLKYAICYFYNAFGPREKGNGKYATLIAKFQQQYLAKKPLTIVKPGTQKRSFTYVGDLAEGIIKVAEQGIGDGYSLNNQNSFSIKQIAKAFNCEVTYINGYSGRKETGEIPTKARDELDWNTTIDIMDYIEEFVRNNRTV